MPVFIICKTEDDLIKIEGTIMSTTFFSGAQGQVTPKSILGCGRISNLSEILWMSLLPEVRWQSDKKCGRYCIHNIFSIISLWEKFTVLKGK